jgi:SAM-dependent methyltransferase
MARDLAERYYQRHHAGETGMKRYGFTFGGDERADWLRKRIGTGRDVLDIGCRDGTLTSYYAKDNRVVGIDLDEQALNDARARYGYEVHRINLNLEPLPFPDARFDVVVAGEVLEHLQFPDEAVKEIHRVLRPGGRFVGSVPNSFRLRNRLKFLMGREYETDPTHLHQFSPQTLRRLLAAFKSHELAFLCGRKLWLHPRLMGTVMAFSCMK